MDLKSMRRIRVTQLKFLLLGLLVLTSAPAFSYSHRSDQQQVREISYSALPVEAKETLKLIRQGGPFRYPRDGIVFGNYEKQLPLKPRGYYHEYTVKTPGLRNRGPRRIVCGQPLVCYYSDDHYKTFSIIKE